MRRLFVAALVLIAPAGAAQMTYPLPPPPTASTVDPGMLGRQGMNPTPTVAYDAASGERITYLFDRMSGGFIEGENTDTHKSWHADIRADGSMTGKDIDGDHWKYDRRAKRYTNLGTGKSCEKSSLRRVCAP